MKPSKFLIFISHSDKYWVLASKLKKRFKLIYGFDSFVSRESIEAGANWKNALKDGLRNSHAMVVLISKEVKESPMVNQEIGWAMCKGIPTFAIIVDDEGLPDGFLNDPQAPTHKNFNEILKHFDENIIPMLPEKNPDEFMHSILEVASRTEDMGYDTYGKLAESVAKADDADNLTPDHVNDYFTAINGEDQATGISSNLHLNKLIEKYDGFLDADSVDFVENSHYYSKHYGHGSDDKT